MWRTKLPNDMPDDADLIEALRSASQSLQPYHVEEGRERLLRAVAEQRAATRRTQKASPMFDLLLGRKRLALVAAGVLAVGAASAVGASGGVSDAAGNVNDVLAALHVTDKTPDVADEQIDAIEQPDGGPEGSDASANENASEGADNADDGINNSNASDTGGDHAADNASEGSGNADSAPDGLPEQADEHADDAADNPDPGVSEDVPANDNADLPDQAEDPPAQNR